MARIAYAVLSFGGFLGMGDPLFAIPWGALTVDATETQPILDVDKKLLDLAVATRLTGRTWLPVPGSTHYGAKPYWN